MPKIIKTSNRNDLPERNMRARDDVNSNFSELRDALGTMSAQLAMRSSKVGSPTMVSATSESVDAIPPQAKSAAFFTWYLNWVNARIAYCDLPRATNYYVSSSDPRASDSNSGLTPDLPFLTIAKCKTVHDASTGNVAFLIKRGDTFDITTGLANTSTKKNVTFGTYGTGDRPILNHFSVKYNQGGWTVDSGDCYKRTDANDIAWIQNQDKRLTEPYMRIQYQGLTKTFTGTLSAGATSGTLSATWASSTGTYEMVFSTLERRLVTLTSGSAAVSFTALTSNETATVTVVIVASNTSLVASTPLSFFYDAVGTTLYINSGVGVTPNSLNLEAVISNSDNGITLVGDGSFAENILCLGWGIHRTNTATQTHAYWSNSSGTDQVAFRGMGGYYGSSHIATHLLSGGGNSGGIATFVECDAGYSSYNVGGESIFNSYSNDGGQQTIFHNPTIPYGTLRSDDWYGGSSVQKLRGQGVYAHTSSQSLKISLIIVYGLTVKASKYGAELGVLGFGSLPDATTLSDVRGFVVNELIEENDGVGVGVQMTPTNMVRMNCASYLKPVDYGIGTLSTGDGVNTTQLSGWSINNVVRVDLTNISLGVFSLYNKQQAMTPRYWNSHIHWKNMNGNICVMDFNTYNGNQDRSAGGELKNCIISADSSTGTPYVGFCNDSTSTTVTQRTNNRYYNMTAAVGNQKGYDQHLNQADLSTQPKILAPAEFNSALSGKGIDLGIEVDIHLSPRVPSHSIGPVAGRPYSTGINSRSAIPIPQNDPTSTTLTDNTVTTTAPKTNSVGYLGTPQNLALDSGSYTLVLTDSAKALDKTTASARTLTIPANASVAFPVGTIIVGSNEGAGALTVAITSDTLRWSGSTGSRVVAQNGSWAIKKLTSTVWRLTGDGIS